ncbi:hypothetical protein K469DRAFT_695607 [Zopfia rhizophila CBS 207.26]|uniref:Uncharacterized protein n=1 Tax=Zopfia rhizophila CBS 207.26 TaxID=1314779 RepID=A0A6A6DIQ7_9PEZI|nr:hypothetical protein K469DRAFT_695607 [Zopfia rhizophila CBS 207.26]
MGGGHILRDGGASKLLEKGTDLLLSSSMSESQAAALNAALTESKLDHLPADIVGQPKGGTDMISTVSNTLEQGNKKTTITPRGTKRNWDAAHTPPAAFSAAEKAGGDSNLVSFKDAQEDEIDLSKQIQGLLREAMKKQQAVMDKELSKLEITMQTLEDTLGKKCEKQRRKAKRMENKLSGATSQLKETKNELAESQQCRAVEQIRTEKRHKIKSVFKKLRKSSSTTDSVHCAWENVRTILNTTISLVAGFAPQETASDLRGSPPEVELILQRLHGDSVDCERTKQLAEQTDSHHLLHAYAATFLCEKTFRTNFPSFDKENSRLLEMYRKEMTVVEDEGERDRYRNCFKEALRLKSDSLICGKHYELSRRYQQQQHPTTRTPLSHW